MSISWPASLPQEFHQQNFQITPPQGAIRTDMETGKAYQRRRFTAAVQPVRGKMWLDATQYSTLLNFWENTTAMGALEFEWVHPITGAPAIFRFIATETPQITVVSGDIYQVQLNLEIIP
jgi:hypothetical protein